MVQVGGRKKIATLPNKITLHENFMMVQPIAAGNSANRSEEERGVAWNGNAEKLNDTELTSGKEGNLEVFGGWWGETGKIRNAFVTKYMIVITLYQMVGGFISLEVEVFIRHSISVEITELDYLYKRE